MQVTTIGLDIAKNVLQVHGIDAAEKVVVRKQLRRSQVLVLRDAAGLPVPRLRAGGWGFHLRDGNQRSID
jgi:transposase